jgi:outer membrane protein assembly factor BamB
MKRLITLCLGLLVAACASDNVEPPAPLAPITNPQIKVEELWNHSIAATDDKLQLHLMLASDGKNVYTMTNSGDIYAYALDGGDKIWKVSRDSSLSAGPTVGEGMLAVGAVDGTVIALNAADGKELWHVNVAGELLTAPAIGGGNVVVRTTDGRIIALAADDGRQRWKVSYQEPRLSVRGACPPVIAGRMVLDGLDSGMLVALNLDDGSQVWQAVVGTPHGSDELSRLSDLDGLLNVSGDEVFAAAYQGQVSDISRISGQVVWSREMSSYTGVALDDANVYVTDVHGAVWALDRHTGVAVWTQPVLRAHNLTAPVVFQNSVVAAGITGDIHFFSKTDGSLQAREHLDSSPVLTPPLVVGDKLLVVSSDGHIAAYTTKPIGK